MSEIDLRELHAYSACTRVDSDKTRLKEFMQNNANTIYQKKNGNYEGFSFF